MSPIAMIWPASLGYTTAAPLGMESTKSASSGRSAREATPPVLTTTEPSGPPIRSSWRKYPLCVWKVAPGASVMVCNRPRGSVSCTRSPGRSGPRLAAAPVGEPVSSSGISGVVTVPESRSAGEHPGDIEVPEQPGHDAVGPEHGQHRGHPRGELDGPHRVLAGQPPVDDGTGRQRDEHRADRRGPPRLGRHRGRRDPVDVSDDVAPADGEVVV